MINPDCRIAMFVLLTVGCITGPVTAQELTREQVSIANSVTADLPAQREDLGHLVPLHAASVMSWLCGDTTVQAALSKSRTECYREIYPSVSPCKAQLQEQAPARGNRKESGRLDVLSFRAAFRACLQQDYVQRLSERGRAAPAFGDGQADPLAARMRAK